MRQVLIWILFILLHIQILMGQTAAGQTGKAVSFYFDNDLLYFPLNDDRDYTFGMGITLAGGKGRKNPAGHLLNLADRATNIHQWHSAAPVSTFSFQWNLKLYTPDNLRISYPIFRDRPYASIFSVISHRISSDPVKGVKIHTSLEIGMLGLFFASQVQGGAHSFSRKITGNEYPYAPMGWHNQISAGGEPTLRYAVSLEKKILPITWRSRKTPEREYFTLSGITCAEAGYLTSISAGIKGKLGWIHNSLSSSQKHDFFIHGSYHFRLQAYNALLQGQFRPSVHHIGHDNLYIMIRQWEAGISWRKNRFSTSYTLCYRSAEIRNTTHPHHYYGQWTMAYHL